MCRVRLELKLLFPLVCGDRVRDGCLWVLAEAGV